MKMTDGEEEAEDQPREWYQEIYQFKGGTLSSNDPDDFRFASATDGFRYSYEGVYPPDVEELWRLHEDAYHYVVKGELVREEIAS